jgi:hypothetical protein
MRVGWRELETVKAKLKLSGNRLRRVHGFILLAFTLAFSALTFWGLSHQSVNDWRSNWNFTATLFTISGPFTGAIARPSQSTCLEFAFKLFPYCAGFLLAGILCQVIPLPFRWGERFFRISMWVLGLTGWFGGGVLSLAYALS